MFDLYKHHHLENLIELGLNITAKIVGMNFDLSIPTNHMLNIIE